MAVPTLLYGPFMVLFFIPITGLAIASVEPEEQANAAGLSNFMRTLAGAFATSLVQSTWSDAGRENQTELSGAMIHGAKAIESYEASGLSHQSAVAMLTQIVEGQSVMLATLRIFGVVTIVFFFSAMLIWLAPKPKGPIDTTAGH
jgi:DHA2 family multidrug resistance protein